jgi:hypothetical protein
LAKAGILRKDVEVLNRDKVAFAKASANTGKGRWQTGIEVLMFFHHYCLFNHEGTN